ncbi:hypothetical protein JCM10213v2_003924 [Rhodosporidiobolus nylandii]
MLPQQQLVAAFGLGTALNTALFGINWQQVLLYMRTNRDNSIYRSAVSFVTLVGTLHTFFSLHAIWQYSVTALVNPSLFLSSPWSFAVDPLLTALIACVVQSSYAWRIYLLSKRSPWLPSLIVALTVVQLGMAIYGTVRALQDSSWSHINSLSWVVGTWLGCVASADILITATLTFYLRRARSDFEQTNSLLGRLILMTVEHNGLTAVTAIVSAALFGAGTTYHLVAGLAIGKFYQISFLASLNARSTLAASLVAARAQPRQAHRSDMYTLPFRTPLFASPSPHGPGQSGSPSDPPRSFRPHLAGSMRPIPSKSRERGSREHGNSEGLSVSVVVESQVVEDRRRDSEWDTELGLGMLSRTTSLEADSTKAGDDVASPLRIAPFLAVPEPY